MNKKDIIDALDRIMATEPLTEIHYITAMPYASYELGKISNGNSAEYTHIRNGGEPWKTKNKRGRR